MISSCQSDCRSRITDNKNRNRAQSSGDTSYKLVHTSSKRNTTCVRGALQWCCHSQLQYTSCLLGHHCHTTRGCWLGRKTLFYDGTVQSVIWSALKVTLYWHWYNTATAISNTAKAGYNESRFSDLRHSATLRFGTSWFKKEQVAKSRLAAEFGWF